MAFTRLSIGLVYKKKKCLVKWLFCNLVEKDSLDERIPLVPEFCEDSFIYRDRVIEGCSLTQIKSKKTPML